MKYIKKLIGFTYYKLKKIFKPSNLIYIIISKTKSKFLSTIRAKKIYDIETATQLAIDDNLEIYNFHKSYFEKFLPSNKNLTLLDFGCGTGRYLELQKLYKKIYLVDISKYNLKIASGVADKLEIEYETIMGSLNSIKSEIDIFFCVGVFGQTYPFNKNTVKKIYSFLQPNGKAIFTVKSIDYKNQKVYKEVLALDELTIKNILEDFNFSMEQVDFPSIRGDTESFVVVELIKNNF
tara:strand:- start:310 stop:1017 length:708 start_codon:yes stop_codon:yes gene_type:complete